MDWNDVRHFLALARTGSVRAAGASLKVSHSTVARRVEALEEQLGVRLFDRHRDGYLLTDAGRQMVPGAERIEREMLDIERGVAGQDARLEGKVRVTCTDPFVGRILMHGLADLSKEHPGLELQIDAESRNLNLSKREADLALRAVTRESSPPEHLLGRKTVPITLASYVGREHRERLDPEGKNARWIGSERERVVEMLVATSSYPNLPIWGSFTSIAMVVEAARAGLGLIMLPTYVADIDPSLVRLEHPDVRHLADFWLLSHPDLRDNARLQAARDCAFDVLSSETALFAGDRPEAWRENEPERRKDGPCIDHGLP